MAGLGAPELLIILAAVMLLFGAAKLPEFARSLGRSARILKTETKGLTDGDDPEDKPQRTLPKVYEERRVYEQPRMYEERRMYED